MAFMAILMGLGLLFYILLGFRYWYLGLRAAGSGLRLRTPGGVWAAFRLANKSTTSNAVKY